MWWLAEDAHQLEGRKELLALTASSLRFGDELRRQ